MAHLAERLRLGTLLPYEYQNLIRVSCGREWLRASREWLISEIPNIVVRRTCPVLFVLRWSGGQKAPAGRCSGCSGRVVPGKPVGGSPSTFYRSTLKMSRSRPIAKGSAVNMDSYSTQTIQIFEDSERG